MKYFALILMLFFAMPVHGAPDLGTYRDIEGVRVYHDHKHDGLWYLSPAVRFCVDHAGKDSSRPSVVFCLRVICSAGG